MANGSNQSSNQVILAIITACSAIVVALVSGYFSVKASNVTGKNTSQIGIIEEQTNKLQDDIKRIDSLAGVPIGTIIPYGGPKEEVRLISQGWLPCDGRKVSRKIYKELFETIGTVWGKGDGVNEFNLPDLRGRFFKRG